MRRTALRLLRVAAGALGALLLANALASALGVRWLVGGTHSHLLVLHAYTHGRQPVDVVFFGSSQTRNAFPVHLVQEALGHELGREATAWNLAVPGGTPPIAPVIAEELLNGPRRPRLLVVEASPFLWNELRRDSGMETYWRWFVPPEDAPALAVGGHLQEAGHALRRWVWGAEALIRLPAFWLSRNSRKALRFAQASRGGIYIPEVYRAWEEGGWPAGLPRPNDLPAEHVKTSIRPLQSGVEWHTALEKTARTCRERGIGLILFEPPVSPELLGHFAPGEREKHHEWLQASSRELEIPFRDYSRLGEQLPPESFRDWLHLSPPGAARFTDLFCREAVAPLLRENGQ